MREHVSNDSVQDSNMAISESIKGNSTSLLIRLFGLFAFLFGVPYLIQGVSILANIFTRQYSLSTYQYQAAFVALDFGLGVTSMVIGVGLFLHKEWARKAWLAYLLILLFIHFQMTAIQFLAGNSNLSWLYKWIGFIVLITITSWAYLSTALAKSRFTR